MVWRIVYYLGIATDVAKRPLQTLYGHDDVVNTIASFTSKTLYMNLSIQSSKGLS